MPVPIASPNYASEVNKSEGDVKVFFRFREPLESAGDYLRYLQQNYLIHAEQIDVGPGDKEGCISARLRKEDAIKIQYMPEYLSQQGVEDLVQEIMLVARYKTRLAS